ncbi:thymidylate kinase [Candidatus Saccharibacteria bacterium]|nr:thymidylate kinase [Candidatus Saccharibacteria bacterium]
MSKRRAAFIVIDGADGSGKATQVKLLAERFAAGGKRVGLLDFPRYSSDGSYFVRRYLAGDYGSLDDINPYEASLFFALDRRDARADIETALASNDVVLSNRFVSSNMIHQGSRIEGPEERAGFFAWLDDLEFSTLRIPRPDLNLILDVPLAISLKLMRERSLLKEQLSDIHEKDIRHQKLSREIYRELCDSFPKAFKRLDCVSATGRLLEEGLINEKIWQVIGAYQPQLLSDP